MSSRSATVRKNETAGTMHILTQRHATVAIDSIHVDERNPNQGDLVAIGESIDANGFFGSVLVQEGSGRIIAGAHRWQAAQQAGAAEIPVTYVDVDDERARRIMLADNRTARRGSDDGEKLAALLQELQATPAALSGTGYDGDALDALLAELGAQQPDLQGDPDAVPEGPDEPISQRGDIIRLGRHVLCVGDAFAPTDVDALLAGRCPTMILTDPPYGIDLDTDFSTIKGSLRALGRAHGTQGKTYAPVIGDDAPFDPAPIMQRFAAVDEQFWFGADYYADRIPDRLAGSWLVWDKRKDSQADAVGSEFELCWSRRRHKRRMLRHDWFGFLSSANGADARHRVHPTQKPVSLLADIMMQWGQPADIVLDLFAGSGSTLVACEQTGRAAYLMEIDPAYCDVIVQRWENLTGKTAVREQATASTAAEASDHARVLAGP